jgi:hypothetical protein
MIVRFSSPAPLSCRDVCVEVSVRNATAVLALEPRRIRFDSSCRFAHRGSAKQTAWPTALVCYQTNRAEVGTFP